MLEQARKRSGLRTISLGALGHEFDRPRGLLDALRTSARRGVYPVSCACRLLDTHVPKKTGEKSASRRPPTGRCSAPTPAGGRGEGRRACQCSRLLPVLPLASNVCAGFQGSNPASCACRVRLRPLRAQPSTRHAHETGRNQRRGSRRDTSARVDGVDVSSPCHPSQRPPPPAPSPSSP